LTALVKPMEKGGGKKKKPFGRVDVCAEEDGEIPTSERLYWPFVKTLCKGRGGQPAVGSRHIGHTT